MPLFTKRELALQKQETLEDFRRRVVVEARKQLKDIPVCVNSLSCIHEAKDFIRHVDAIVADSHYWNT